MYKPRRISNEKYYNKAVPSGKVGETPEIIYEMAEEKSWGSGRRKWQSSRVQDCDELLIAAGPEF